MSGNCTRAGQPRRSLGRRRAGITLLATVALCTGEARAQPAATEPGPSDLSVCRAGAVTLEAADDVDLRAFARRLHGTWLLRTRTIQGLTIDTNSRFYFDLDLEGATAGRATGTALMIDRGNLGVMDPLGACKACEADASLGALWTVEIEAPEQGRQVSLRMHGEYLGSYGDFRKGVTATEQTTFFRHRDAYFAGNLTSPAGGQGMPDDVWERIGLTEDTLTYVSCRGGYIDRFEKLSGERPLVGGAALADAWARVKRDGSLLNPPHVGSRQP